MSCPARIDTGHGKRPGVSVIRSGRKPALRLVIQLPKHASVIVCTDSNERGVSSDPLLGLDHTTGFVLRSMGAVMNVVRDSLQRDVNDDKGYGHEASEVRR